MKVSAIGTSPTSRDVRVAKGAKADIDQVAVTKDAILPNNP